MNGRACLRLGFAQGEQGETAGVVKFGYFQKIYSIIVQI